MSQQNRNIKITFSIYDILSPNEVTTNVQVDECTIVRLIQKLVQHAINVTVEKYDEGEIKIKIPVTSLLTFILKLV